MPALGDWRGRGIEEQMAGRRELAHPPVGTNKLEGGEAAVAVFGG